MAAFLGSDVPHGLAGQISVLFASVGKCKSENTVRGRDLNSTPLHCYLNPQMMAGKIQVSQLEFEPTARAFNWKFVCT